MLEQVGLFNDLSPKLKEQLEEKLQSFGKRVRFKFHISHPNPDPEKKNGVNIWPFLYTLDPVTFSITDKLEDRKEKQKVKKIGLVDTTDERGNPNKFKRVRVKASDAGIADFDLEDIEQVSAVTYLLLHPKLTDGQFVDKNKQQVFELVDEKKVATASRAERSIKLAALNAAQAMSEAEVIQFANAMSWDGTEEEEVLRSKIEELAETTPAFFNELIAGKTVEYQAIIKVATDKKIIAFDPVDNKYVWVGSNAIIVSLPVNGEKTEIEKFAQWLATGGQKADEIYKKIKSLIK